MTRDTNDARGAWSITSAGQLADARRSVDLFGNHTAGRSGNRPDDGRVDLLVSAGEQLDPIEAARSWLWDETRTSDLPAALLSHARASVEIAFTHFRELDMMAGELAHDANETGVLDLVRIERIDQMADALRAYSDRLRLLLDQANHDPDRATERMRNGLQAASEGGLPALVAAL